MPGASDHLSHDTSGSDDLVNSDRLPCLLPLQKLRYHMTATLYPSNSVDQIINTLDAPRDVRNEAYSLAEDLQHNNPGVWGRSPKTVAAACIYAASLSTGAGITQSAIADAAGCARNTIQEIYPIAVTHIEAELKDGEDR